MHHTEAIMFSRAAMRTLAILATALLQGCAAILASNEPLRNGLIPQVQQGMTREQVTAVQSTTTWRINDRGGSDSKN
jgi:hypothetical protein